MGDFLAEMATLSRERAARARAAVPLAEMERRALARGRARAIPAGGFVLIAEVKLASPSEGLLGRIAAVPGSSEAIGQVVSQANVYGSAGAGLISVLSEPSRFGGELSHVAAAADAMSAGVPVMRKDFLVDAYQVWEARAAGASAVLAVLLVAQLVQEDGLIGEEAMWLTRPIGPGRLLAAKLLGAAVMLVSRLKLPEASLNLLLAMLKLASPEVPAAGVKVAV
jgi:indole-3-glycerol phosphate synthase